jgi:hypothetical protein
MQRIGIDFATGIISLDNKTRIADLVEQAKPTPDTREWKVDIGEALLGDIVVHVHASRSPSLIRISFSPPKNLDFWESDRYAAKITQMVTKMLGEKSNSCGSFEWGRVELCSEWRDGGWGAYFSFTQTPNPSFEQTC